MPGKYVKVQEQIFGEQVRQGTFGVDFHHAESSVRFF